MAKRRKIFVSHSYKDADLYHELIAALRYRSHFSFQDVSVPDISLIEADNPKPALRKRIQKCDVVIVFTRPVASKSKYIKYELDTAANLGKPIIGLKPSGDANVSRFVRQRAKRIIEWDVEEIVQQIRKPGSSLLKVPATYCEVDDSANIDAYSVEPEPKPGLRQMLLRAFGFGSPTPRLGGVPSRNIERSRTPRLPESKR